METYMTAKDVAAFIKLSLTSVRRLTMRKEIPFYKINRSVRYKLNEIETWLENKKLAEMAVAYPAKNEGENDGHR
jgi:excisionase family DNA binding protein